MHRDRPIPVSDEVRRRLAAQRRSDTRPELELRRLLHASGLRYRVGYPVPGMPRRTIDIAFTRAKLAVFVDGCFWHGCPVHCVPPKSNYAWWGDKLAANRRRDEETSASLEASGWRVLRVWEHEDAQRSADLVAALYRDCHPLASGLERCEVEGEVGAESPLCR